MVVAQYLSSTGSLFADVARQKKSSARHRLAIFRYRFDLIGSLGVAT
jgi:hypothetical protein